MKAEFVTPQQIDVLRAVQAAERGTGPRIICLPAGHGVGKSWLCSELTIWAGGTHSRAVVVTTAPTWRQVERILWKEINFTWSQVGLPGTCLQTAYRLDGSEADGVSTDDKQKLQGMHGPFVFCVADECPGVLPGIIETILRGITVNTNWIFLAPGNPLEPGGAFRDLCDSPRSKTIFLSCLDHPNVIHQREIVPGAVSFQWCLEMIEDTCEEIDDPGKIETLEHLRLDMLAGKTPSGKPYNQWAHSVEDALGNLQAVYWNPHGWTDAVWYRPSPLAQSRMLGRFPDEGDDILIPLRWVEAAMVRGEDVLDRISKMQAGKIPAELVPEWDMANPCVVAMDPARMGDNLTVIIARRGRVVLPAEEHSRELTNITAMRFAEAYRRHGAGFGAIDIGAVGAGVYDQIVSRAENGDISIYPIDFGGRPGEIYSKVQFANKRSQMYWGLRCLLEKNAIDLPRDEVLLKQLTSLRYGFNLLGQLVIESKKEMKKRGIKSPDRADTLAMTCDEAIEGAWPDTGTDPSWFTEVYDGAAGQGGETVPDATWAEAAYAGVFD